MLFLIPLPNGAQRAIKLDDVEFEIKDDPSNAAMKVVTFYKSNNEVIETVIPEERVRLMMEALEKEGRII